MLANFSTTSITEAVKLAVTIVQNQHGGTVTL